MGRASLGWLRGDKDLSLTWFRLRVALRFSVGI